MDETTTNPEQPQVKRRDHFKGVVRKLTIAGAMIDLGLDRPGFLHLAQISDKPVKRIEDILSEGQEIDVWVRKADPGKEYIELTTSEPLALEWRDIKRGMKISGNVVKIEKFGAFVEIGAERPGLVHVSEMSHDYVRTPEEVVRVGDIIEAVVLDVDRRKRQIKLSIKALLDKPEAIMQAAREEAEPENEGPVPNAMEYALRAAMEKSKEKEGRSKRSKRSRGGNDDLEDIFSRTLENYNDK